MPINNIPEKTTSAYREELETILGHLYRFMPKAMLSPNRYKYFRLVNSLREKTFPTGKRDIRAMEWRPGTTFKTDLSERYGCEIHYRYFQEEYETQIFQKLLAPGSVVFDIGANFGLYTILSAQAVSPVGRVYAFEPVERSFDLLTENIRINNLDDVATCYNVCVGAADGQTEFYVTEDTAFSGMAFTQRSRLLQTKNVQVRSIDSFFRETRHASIHAVKIDVEGFEYAVIAGAMDTLRNSPETVILLEVSAKNLTPERKADLLSSLENLYALGFRAWCCGENSDEMQAYSSCAELVELPSAAVFLVRAGSARENDLLRAHAMVVKSLKIESSMDVADPLSIALGEEIYNLIETLQVRFDVVRRERNERKDIHKRWERASLPTLVWYRYGKDMKALLAPLRTLLTRVNNLIRRK